MDTAKLTLVEGLHFEGATGSGHSVSMDAAAAHGGQDKGARPMEMLLLALAGCTAMDVISILRKKKQPVAEFSIEVHGERVEDHPKRFGRIELVFVVRGNDIDEKAVARSIELSYNKYCSVRATLNGNPEIVTSHRIEPT